MKNIAVITEYNPFHKGHALQIEKIKELFSNDVRIIAIMSGNTVQRGEGAIYGKYARAHAALSAGVSAVFEIPFPYSSSTAEIFARAGVYIAGALGNIDALVFGSECGDIKKLEEISLRMESEEFCAKMEMISQNNKDMPYPKRRETAYRELYQEDLAMSANDILGVEYINAMRRLGADMEVVTYKREEGFSAGKTRREIRLEGSFLGVDEKSREIFENSVMLDSNKLEAQLFGCLLRADVGELLKVFDMPKDLAYKMKAESERSEDYREFLERMKGAGYTDARIRRELLYLWCDVEKIDHLPLYTALLGMNEKGREYLAQIRKTKKIQVVTKPADYKKFPEIATQINLNLEADDLFALASAKPLPYGWSLLTTPLMKK